MPGASLLPRIAMGQHAQRFLDLAERRHAGRQDQRRAGFGERMQQWRIGQVAGADLDARQIERQQERQRLIGSNGVDRNSMPRALARAISG